MKPHRGARPLALLATLFFLLLGTLAQAAPAPRYTFIDLGALGARGAVPLAINNRGDVGGVSAVTPPGGFIDSHAFLWQNGHMRDLGQELPSQTQSELSAMTDRGLLVIETDQGVWLWRDGVWTRLGFHAHVDGINRQEHFVGTLRPGTTTQRGFAYRNGVLQELGTLGGSWSSAAAINDMGVIVGSSTLAGDMSSRGFVYRKGAMTALGTLGGLSSSAQDINNRGVVVGNSHDAAGNWVVFLHDGRSMRAVPNLPEGSVAYALNDHGTLIGTSQHGGFVYDRGVSTLLIDVPKVRSGGYTRLVPMAINERGWIVGSAVKQTDPYPHAFLMIPK